MPARGFRRQKKTNRDGTTAAPKRSILHRESGGGGADGSLGVEIEDESHPAISPASSAGGEAKVYFLPARGVCCLEWGCTRRLQTRKVVDICFVVVMEA